jgi:ABC-2 type transport system permease protein
MSTLTDPTTTSGPSHTDSGSGHALGADPAVRNAWVLVMNREIVVRALNKAFVISLLITIALIAGLSAFMAWQATRTESFTVAVAPGDEVAVAAVEASAAEGAEAEPEMEIVALEVSDDAAARAALEDGTADAWLHRGDDGWTLASGDEPDQLLVHMLSTSVSDAVVAANAAEAGTSIDVLTAESELRAERLDGDAVSSQVDFLAGYALAFLFLIGAIGSGQMIASSVVEEKQSRLVEILATRVPLRHLLAGKILGSSVIALAQNVLFATVGLIGLSFTPVAELLPALSASLAWFVGFFLVGFIAVAAIYAVCGALASRMEDLSSTTSPVMMLLMLVFFVTFTADGAFERILSFVPLASVVSMPVRVLNGDAAWWEPVLSLGLLAAFAALAVVVCERAYRGALMQTRGRVSWRRALTAEA